MFEKVTTEQFEILPNEVVHRPTGARFTRYPGERLMRLAIWGGAGSHFEFRKADILKMAQQLIESDAQPEHFGPAQ
jgi:hypothetical protein